MAHPLADIRVLIAEDHFAMRHMIVTAMRDKHVPIVHTAINGKKAQEMMEEAYREGQPYHVVFLDWEMPLMSGLDVLKYFRALPQFDSTAFVMVTSISKQSDVLEAIKAGATAYMIKPVSQIAIAKRFDEILVWLKQKKAI